MAPKVAQILPLPVHKEDLDRDEKVTTLSIDEGALSIFAFMLWSIKHHPQTRSP